MGIATARLTATQAKASGFDPVHAMVAQHDRAHFYPDSRMMFITLIADAKTRKIIGIEAAGHQGDSIKTRVDAIAPLFQTGLNVDDVCVLETGYAPPVRIGHGYHQQCRQCAGQYPGKKEHPH